MDLSIIIVNWNSKEFLQECLKSVLSTTNNISFEILVIDNASYDGADKMLKTFYPQVRFLQSEKNLGFAKANNAAFKESIGTNLLFLNPDTEINSSAIESLFNHVQKLPNVGALGCKLLNGDKSIQTSCIQAFPTIVNQLINSEFLRAVFPKSPLWGMSALFCFKDEPSQVDVISGACLMVKRSVFEEVGLFSEDYFMYAEDLDLCYKIKQAGYINYYIPSTTVIHFGGGSTEKSPSDFSVVMMRESVWRYMEKFHGKTYGLAYRASMAVSAVGRLIMLAVLMPLQFLGYRNSLGCASLRKWWIVLAWSLGIKSPVSN